MLDKIVSISLVLFFGSGFFLYLVTFFKSLGTSEGYKLKEKEFEIKELEIELARIHKDNLHLERRLFDEKTQKSNIMLEILEKTMYDFDKTPEEKIEEMLHNHYVLYKKEEL